MTTNAELEAAVVKALALEDDDLDLFEIRRIIETARPLWDTLARHGKVDAFGGKEFRRVFPTTLAFIRREVNLGPDGSSVWPCPGTHREEER